MSPDLSELFLADPKQACTQADGGVKIVDTRRLVDHRQKHIPNAISIPFTSFMTMHGLAFYLPDEEEFQAILSLRGISRDTLVIAYDDYSGKHACRLLYTLEMFGHKKLGLLDRPFGIYEKEGWPVSSEEPRTSPVEYRYMERPDVVTKEKILANIASPSFYLLDVRAPEDMALGFIPGARNLPWYELTTQSRIFRPLEEVRPIVDRLRIPKNADIVTYCEEGTSSVLVLYALRRLGYQNVSNYLASYGEWGTDPELPKERIWPKAN